MRTTKGNENCNPSLHSEISLQKLVLFFVCHFTSVLSQCETGLEPACVWTHDKDTALLWKMNREGQESFVELSKCIKPCGIGIIHSPWLEARTAEGHAEIEYKIYGTSKVYFRLNMHFDDTNFHQIFSKSGNYAHGYPKHWTSQRVQLPATHTQYKLVLKALLPSPDAMVAVKGITLDGTVYLTSTSSSTSSTTPRSSTPTTAFSTSTSTTTTSTTTTTTTTTKPISEEEEISPTHYDAEIEEIATDIPESSETSKNIDYFSEDDEADDEDERRFQALEVEDFIGEEDLIEGYTTVVEPQLCMYK